MRKVSWEDPRTFSLPSNAFKGFAKMCMPSCTRRRVLGLFLLSV